MQKLLTTFETPDSFASQIGGALASLRRGASAALGAVARVAHEIDDKPSPTRDLERGSRFPGR